MRVKRYNPEDITYGFGEPWPESPDGILVDAREALPVEAERDRLREKVQALETRLRKSDERVQRQAQIFDTNLQLGVRVAELEAEVERLKAEVGRLEKTYNEGYDDGYDAGLEDSR